ncbi:MAG: hypothetical protein EA405_04530 [Rhodospirillales bacterium]|nr:MAG: hypothetical protein EA405_04530 [Rhodospirillales bacterium]
MTTDALPYEHWIDEALRVVIRRALAHMAEHGLPGTHHFYLTFRTDAEGVVLSPRLRAQHKEEMTVVIQHQFWDPVVDDEALSITLKFGGRKERLRMPFAALTAFADPSVNFGLQFRKPASDEPTADEASLPPPDAPAEADRGSGEVIALDTFRKK